MKNIIENVNNAALSRGIIEIPRLYDLLSSPIVKYKDCVLFDIFLNDFSKKQYNNFQDSIGFESFINHFHLCDYCHKKGLAVLKLGLCITELIKYKLRYYYPEEKFTIVVSYDMESQNDCVIRFYKQRSGIRYLADDLDGFTLEAIGEIDV